MNPNYRRFFKNLSLLFLLNILIKPLWLFGVDLAVQNTVSEAEYGIYFSLFNFSLLLHIILDLGISHYNNREIAQNPELLSDRFSKLVILKALLSFIYIVIAISIAMLIGYDSYRLQLLFFLLINQVLLSYILFFRTNITGLQLFKTDALLSVLDKSLMIVLISFLLWILIGRESFSISHFILGQTSALFPVALFTFFLVKNRAGFTWRFSNKDWHTTLKSTLPYAVLILLMTIYFRIDAVMIERLLGENGARQAGMYAASFRLLDAVNIVGYLLASFLLPLFAKNLKKKSGIAELSSLCFTAIISLAISVCITTWVHADSIVRILYVKGTAEYAQILRVLLCTFVPMSSMYVYSTLLTADGQMKSQSKIAMIGILLNLILNVILILNYNALGAAIATVITQSIVAVLIYRLVRKRYNLDSQNKFMIKCLALGLIGLAIGFLIKDLISYPIISIALTFSAMIILALVIKTIDRKELLGLLDMKSL